MPEIEFTIDTESGESRTEIKGIAGAACEKTAQQLKKLLGTPALDEKTKEFFLKPETKRQVKGK